MDADSLSADARDGECRHCPLPFVHDQSEVHRFEILDTPPDPELDRIVKIAALVCDTPIAAISFLDHDRNWIKAIVGLALQEHGRTYSFCHRTVQRAGITILDEDMLLSGFADHPLIACEKPLKFHAGVPLITPRGIAIGALGVSDYQAHKLSSAHAEVLMQLAQQAMDYLERRRQERVRERERALGARVAAKVQVSAWQVEAPGGDLTVTAEGFRLLEAQPSPGPLTHAWFAQFLTAEDFTRLQNAVIAAAKDSVPQVLETQALTAFGHKRRLRHTIVYERSPWSADRVVGLIEDITEAQPESSVEAPRRLETLGLLAGGIAHEFNNLLPVIKGYLEFARQDARGNSKVLDSLAICLQACQSAQQFAQQLLNFGHEKPGEPEQILNVVEMVAQICDMLRATLLRGTDLKFLKTHAVPRVRIDAAQLQQVLMNLLIKAQDALRGPRREITVSVDEVQFEEAHLKLDLARGKYARILITDTGIGMSARTQAQVFEPFFTTRADQGGHGLGLSTVKSIVQTHRGALELNSEPGAGTAVAVYLPVVDEAGDEVVVEAKPSRSGRKTQGKVFFLDDQHWLAPLAARYLADEGYDCRAFARTDELLDALEGQTPVDLVITDQNMPGTNGMEVVARVKALRPALPVVLISGSTSPELKAQAVRAGADGLIFKPALADELVPVVEGLLRD